MADNSNEEVNKRHDTAIYPDLDESMIPGASLRGRLPESLTKTELLRWLRCRKGASLSGKKAELVQRVNHYITNGWDRKYLVNPDKQSVKIYTEDTVQSPSGFVQAMLDYPPPAGYTNCLNNVPAIEDSDIYQYFLIKCDGTQSTAQKHRNNGWIFYKSDKVICSEFNLDFDKEIMMVRGDVVASFDRGFITSSKPKKKYPVHIALDKHSGSILGARCLCKAGFGGFCKHVAAVLYHVMDNQRSGNRFTPAAESQTSKLQTWHKPRVLGQACIKFADIEMQSFNYEKDCVDGQSAKKARTDYKTFSSCPDGQNCVTQSKIEKFAQELSSFGVAHQLVDILAGNNCEPVHHAPPSLPQSTVQNVAEAGSPDHCNISLFEGNFTVSQAQHSFYEDHVKITTSEEQRQISQQSVGQSGNEFWKQERSKRITASNFREVAHRSKYPADKLVARMIHPQEFGSAHTSWGKQAEPLALAQYKTVQEQNGLTVTGKDLGLIVSPNYPYLGASPDWFVTCTDASTGFVENGLVEVKSLSKHANLTPIEAASLKDTFFTLDDRGKICIKKDHSYYYQIQGQLNICCVNWCDLVVWTPRGIEIQRIKRDVEFWKYLLPKLSEFYFGHVLPQLTKPEHSNE